jgi:folylpolyglutamate synthase/dihydropteroate synthase
LGYNEAQILHGLQTIYNPGRFEWISPTFFVDSANNKQNIRLLKNMLSNDISESDVIIFGTTQADPVYAAQLANIFPRQRKILVDGFCERALPCSDY